MKNLRVIQSDFVTSAADPAGYPATDLPEVAFVGRSNVGKSSLINALCQRRKLVRVSNTPGRTRTLNFFDAALQVGQSKERKVRLCDLPGYGYAKVSKAERVSWEKMIESYLRDRQSLRAVVLIIDAEVGPTEQDAEMLTFLRASGRQAVVVATKLDRLTKAKRIPALRAAEQTLGLPRDFLMGVSSVEGLGLEEAWFKLLDYC
jgi:GTP-binding protein